MTERRFLVPIWILNYLKYYTTYKTYTQPLPYNHVSWRKAFIYHSVHGKLNIKWCHTAVIWVVNIPWNLVVYQTISYHDMILCSHHFALWTTVAIYIDFSFIVIIIYKDTSKMTIYAYVLDCIFYEKYYLFHIDLS